VAFPHPQTCEDHYWEEEKSSCGGIAWKFFERAIDVAEYRDAEDDVNPAKNRALGGAIHDRLLKLGWAIVCDMYKLDP
jgi:hypothetical protein